MISPAPVGHPQGLTEVINLAVGMGHDVRVVADIEVVPEDGGYEFRQSGIAGIGGVVEGVLAIAIRVIEANALRRVAEPIGLLLGVEVDDRNVLVHRPTVFLMAADGDVQIFVAFGCAQVGGDEAVQNIKFTHNGQEVVRLF